MSMPENVAANRRGSWIAIAIASVALVLSIRSYFASDQRMIPGVSYIGLRDDVRGDNIGFIRAEYGMVAIDSLSLDDSRKASIILTPAGVTISIKKDGRVLKFWEFNENSEPDHGPTP